MLKVKKLDPDAIIPTCAHPGEDLGFDLYALEGTLLLPGSVTKVRTGISARFVSSASWGLLVRDRSSMAVRGITVSSGVIDAGYSGEICVLMTLSSDTNFWEDGYTIKKGDKIAQMIPTPVFTAVEITEVDELPLSSRGEDGFGSTGQ